MWAKMIGLLFFAAAVAALIAGFQIVALVSAAIGLLLIASTAKSSRPRTRRSGESDWLGNGMTSHDAHLMMNTGRDDHTRERDDSRDSGDCGSSDRDDSNSSDEGASSDEGGGGDCGSSDGGSGSD